MNPHLLNILLAKKSSLGAKVRAILAKYGTDAHVYLPGIGTISGLTAGNWLDSGGTTPATVDNPVGLVLDGAGSVGAELVTNGDFSNGATGWQVVTSGNGTVAFVNGMAILTSAKNYPADLAAIYKAINLDAGTYEITGTVVARDTSFFWYIIGTAYGEGSISGNAYSPSVGNFMRKIHVPTSGNVWFELRSSGSLTVDNISVKKVTGIHLTQATTANKPQLSKRYNLLTKTEDFSHSDWTKAAVSITPDAITASDGTLTADLILETVTNTTHRINKATTIIDGTPVKATIRFKQHTVGRNLRLLIQSGSNYVITVFSSADGTILSQTDSLGSIFSNKVNYTSAADSYGFYTVGISANTAGTTSVTMTMDITDGTNGSYAGDITKGIYLWGASLVPTSQASLPYQRVNTATDYDTVGFPYKFDMLDAGDQLTATFPAGYESATVIDVVPSGQVTSLAQNIVGTYNINTDTNGRFVFRDALSAGDLAIMQAYVNKLVGL